MDSQLGVFSVSVQGVRKDFLPECDIDDRMRDARWRMQMQDSIIVELLPSRLAEASERE